MRGFLTRESETLYLELGSRAYGEIASQENDDFVLGRFRQASTEVRPYVVSYGSWRNYGTHTVPRSTYRSTWWEDYDYDPTYGIGSDPKTEADDAKLLETQEAEYDTLLRIALEWDMDPSEVAEMVQRGWVNLGDFSLRRPKRIHEVVEGRWEEWEDD